MARPEHLRHLADDLWLVADELSGAAALPGMDADTLASLVEIVADSARTQGLDRLPILTAWVGENLTALDAEPGGAEVARGLIAELLTAAHAYCLSPADPEALAGLAARLADPAWPNPLPRTLLNNLPGLFQAWPVDAVLDEGSEFDDSSLPPQAATSPVEGVGAAVPDASPDATGVALAPAAPFGGSDEPIPLVEPADETPIPLVELEVAESSEVGEGEERAAGGSAFTRVAIPLGVDAALIDDFFQEAPDIASELAALLRSAGDGVLVGEAVAEARRLAHTIKGDAALLEETAIETLAHRLEDLLELLGQEPPEPALAALLVEAADALECLFEGIERGVERVELDLQSLLDALEGWRRHLATVGSQTAGLTGGAEEPPAQPAPPLEGENTQAPGAFSLATDPNLDPALFDAFLTEAPEPAETLIEQVRLANGVLTGAGAREASALARTLQGAAALIGLGPMAALAEGLCRAFDRAAIGGVDADLAALLVAGVAVLEQQFGALGETEAPLSADPAAVIQALDAWVNSAPDGAPASLEGDGLDGLPPGDDDLGGGAPVAWTSLVIDPTVDPRLVDAFFQETPDQVAELALLLRGGELDAGAVMAAQRLAHTVKGSAALLGIAAMEGLCHCLEDVMERLGDGGLPAGLGALLVEVADALEALVDGLIGRLEGIDLDLAPLLVGLGDWQARLTRADEVDEVWGAEVSEDTGTDTGGAEGISLAPTAGIDPRLWDAFLCETPGQAEELIELLRSRQGLLSGADAEDAERLAHTVKGAASLTGIAAMARLAEALEDCLEGCHEQAPPPDLAALLCQAAEGLEGQFAHLGEAEAPAEVAATGLIQVLGEWAARLAPPDEGDEAGLSPVELLETQGVDLQPAPDLNPRLWEAFLEETPAQAEQLIDALRSAEGRLTGESAHEAERLAHTVKGSANLIGVPIMGRLAEEMEDALEVLEGRPADDEVAALLLAAAGVLEYQFGYLGEASAPADADPGRVVRALADWTGRMATVETEDEADATAGVDLRPSADLNPRLWDAFLTETPGQAEQLIDTLRAAEGRLTGEAAHEAERLAHTVKGAANLIGVPAMGRLAEAMEDALELLAGRPADEEIAARLLAAVEVLEVQFGYLGEAVAPAECDPSRVITALAEWTAGRAPLEEGETEAAEPAWTEAPIETAVVEQTGFGAAGWTDLRVSPDVDPRLVEAFFQETPDQAAELAGMLRDAGAGSLAGERVTVAQRLAHTVKGSAALLGIGSIEGLAHRLEDVMELLGESAPPAELADLLVEVADVLEALFDALAQRVEGVDLEIERLIAGLGDWAERLGGSAAEAAGEGTPAFPSAGAVDLRPAADLDPRLWEAFLSETPAQAEQLIETLSGPQGCPIGEAAHEAERLAHTVKGSANLIGVPAMGRLAEAIEDALEALVEGPADERAALLLADAVGVLENQFAYLGSEAAPEAADPAAAILALDGWRAGRLGSATGTEAGSGPAWTDVRISPDVDSRLVEAFFQEAPDQAAELASMLRGAGGGTLAAGRVTEAQRLAHTVKGSAALLGIASVEGFAHRLEDVMELLGDMAPEAELVDLLVEVADALEGLFDAILQRLDGVAIDTEGLVHRLSQWAVRLGGQPEGPAVTQDEAGAVPSEDLLWAPDTDPKELDRFFLEIPERAERLALLLERSQIGVEDRRKEAVDLAARMHTAGERVGIRLLTEFAANLRTILVNSGDLSAAGMEALTENAATLREVMAAVQGMVEPSEDFWERVQLVADWAKRLTQSGAPTKPISKAVPPPAAAPAADAKDKEKEEGVATTLRVPTQRIDALMRLVGEMTTSVAQVQGRLQTVLDRVVSIHRQSQVTSQKFVDLQGLVEARSIPASMAGPETRKAPADLGADEFDPLEMDQYHEIHSISSALSEAFADGLQLSRLAEDDLTELAAIAHHQSRISREVNEAVLATRMIPVNVLTPRLERAVRESCRASGKHAELHIEGDQLLVDTDIINGLRDPLMHLLRNSVDHGIETVAERRARGKPDAGRIDVSFRRQGNVILVRIRDDGGGFNVARIRATAARRGLQIAAEVSEAEVIRLILQPGFSTKEAVTKLSGRGIGMDVVAQAVRALKGSIILGNLPGGGSETLLRLPLTLVSVPVLLVGAVGQVFAVPGDDIDQLLYPEPGAIAHSDEQGWTFRRGDTTYPLRSLNALIGREAEDAALARHTTGSILLVHDELGQQAVALDIAIERRDVVVQRLGQWLPQVHGINGACILADGSVAPALDMRALISDRSAHLELPPLPAEVAAQRQITVMVVDDSLSARQALQIAMEGQGYRVVSAKDGLDAISVLDDESPEIVLTDMEMPRMNGLELTRHIRAQRETHHLPVVMITSRSTAKHRQQAEKAGVDEYVTKPFDNDDLAALVRGLLERAVAPEEAHA